MSAAHGLAVSGARSLLLAAIVIAAFGGGVGAAEPIPERVDPEAIPNYFRLRPDVATAGLPTAAGLARLREMGFGIVIDLRPAAEGIESERAAVLAAGIRHISVPLTPQTFSMADARAVAAILDEEGRGPVLIHCTTGNRAGGLWTIVETMRGRPYEEALAEGRRAGLRSEAMVDAVRRVAGRHPDIH